MIPDSQLTPSPFFRGILAAVVVALPFWAGLAWVMFR